MLVVGLSALAHDNDQSRVCGGMLCLESFPRICARPVVRRSRQPSRFWLSDRGGNRPILALSVFFEPP
jgi:hypothetical protein